MEILTEIVLGTIYFGIFLGICFIFAPELFILFASPFCFLYEAYMLNKEGKAEPPKPIEHFVPEEHVGKHAKTVRPLKPSGRILLNDELFEAITDMGFIQEGTLVKIIDIRYHQYVVAPLDNEA